MKIISVPLPTDAAIERGILSVKRQVKVTRSAFNKQECKNFLRLYLFCLCYGDSGLTSAMTSHLMHNAPNKPIFNATTKSYFKE